MSSARCCWRAGSRAEAAVALSAEGASSLAPSPWERDGRRRFLRPWQVTDPSIIARKLAPLRESAEGLWAELPAGIASLDRFVSSMARQLSAEAEK